MILRTRDIIEQNRHGEISKGYIRTVSGISPTDWKRYTFGDIYTERKEPGSEELPLLMVSIHSGVSDGEVDEEELPKKVKRIEDKSQYKKAVSGDLVFNMMRAWQGAIGTVRTTGMVSPAYIVAKPNDKVYPLFMDYYTRTPQMINQINRQSYGVTDFRKRLYWDSFATIGCTLPPIEEQRKIAAILTTQDRVIELKEKHLAEKQRQKKYLMQQLLTGKKRLPGFSGKWEKIKFKEIGEIVSGGTPNTSTLSYWNGDIPWCTPTDISKSGKYIYDTEKKLSKSGLDNSSAVLLPSDSILMCSRASIGPRCINVKPMATNQGFKSIICNTQIANVSFVYDLLELCVPDFIRLSSGSTFLELSKKDFEEYQVTIPPLCEQTAIAEVLSAADHEIDLLRQDIEQEKQKEKALMQLLLTGIVRVNV